METRSSLVGSIEVTINHLVFRAISYAVCEERGVDERTKWHLCFRKSDGAAEEHKSVK